MSTKVMNDENLEDLNENVIHDPDVLAEEAQVEDQDGASIDETKQKAKKHGHLSKEEFIESGGKEEDYKTEEEFNEFGDSYSKLKPVLDTLHRKLDKRDKEIEALIDYNIRIEEREKQRARQEVATMLKHAKETGDAEGIEKLTAEKLKLEWQESQRQQDQIQSRKQEVLNRFVDRNKHWYNAEHPELMAKCQFIDNELRAYYPNITLDDLAEKVEKRMKQEHPDICGSGHIDRPVVSSTRSSINKSTASSNEISEDRLFKQLVERDPDIQHIYDSNRRICEKKGVSFTKKEFVQQLKDRGEI